MRTLIAGIAGGVVVFAWGFVSHGLLGLAESTVKPLPNEEAVTSAVKGLDGPGIYAIPSFSHEEIKNDAAKKKAHDEKYNQGPVGLVVRAPDGVSMNDMTTQMAYSLGFDILGALIVALFIGASSSMAGALPRAIAAGGLGAFAWISQNAQQWVWYHYPWEYERAELINAVVSWAAAGLVMALILKTKKAGAPPAK